MRARQHVLSTYYVLDAFKHYSMEPSWDQQLLGGGWAKSPRIPALWASVHPFDGGGVWGEVLRAEESELPKDTAAQHSWTKPRPA